MVEIEYDPYFVKIISKIKEGFIKQKIKKQIIKIIENPEIGKPMRHARKGTREVYVKPFRLSYAYIYAYIKGENKIILLELYHKDEQ